ncbi:MAG: caa(3)-type oxidase subunit IV [Bdellovibrionaceae bacterium]|nr:caa(3)-type oxidase subunit IV [Pseudobdellovibrionaceae bacterium]
MSHHDSHPVPHDDAHDAHEAEHIRKHIKLYLLIGGVLMLFTLLTVLISKVDIDGALGWHGHVANITVGLIIATFKASLVALIFMHLNSEKPTIYRFLIFVAFLPSR